MVPILSHLFTEDNYTYSAERDAGVWEHAHALAGWLRSACRMLPWEDSNIYIVVDLLTGLQVCCIGHL